MGAWRCEPDAELAESVRRGSLADFGVLFGRHREAALRYATRLARSPALADDLVSEAFLSTFTALRAGDGPTQSFRAYLLTAVRSAYVDAVRRSARQPCVAGPLDHLDDLASRGPLLVDVAGEPEFDAEAAGRAYRGLPHPWQRVLWLTTVEGRSHAETAALLGVKAESVRVLAYRAREGLRRAFIQEHLQPSAEPECAEVVAHLPALARAALRRSKVAAVETHVRACSPCRARVAEAQEVGRRIAAARAGGRAGERRGSEVSSR